MGTPQQVEGSNHVWKVFNNPHLDACPNCKSEALTYVGYNHSYSPGLCAKIYHCDHCNSWVDVLRPKNTNAGHIGRPRLKKSLGFVSV